MRHLGERRLQTLAVAVGADPQLKSAVRREARLALLVARHERDAPRRIDARSVAGLLRIHGDADAEQPAVGLAAPLALAQGIAADRVDRLLEGLRIVAGIEVALGDVVERHLLRPHQAAHAQLGGLDAEVAGERVERHLEREADAGARNAAIRQDRRLVGRDRIGAAAIMRKVVEAGEDAADLPASRQAENG